jgi:hypothetical protein
MRLVEKSWDNVQQRCLNNVYALFHNAKTLGFDFKMCEKYFLSTKLFWNLSRC